MATFTVSYNPNVVAKVLGTFATKTVTADQMILGNDGSVTFQTYDPMLGYPNVDIVASGTYVEITKN